MNATVELLAKRPFSDVRATEIARLAGMPQSNFYSYFGNVEEVILAIAGEVSADSLVDFLDGDWAGEAGVEQARRLVGAALALWRQHRDILSLVGVLADRRHGPFPALRVRQMRALYKAFEAKVVGALAAGAIHAAVTPRLVGYECAGLLVAIGQADDLLMASGFTQAELVETTARLLHRMATGMTPEPPSAGP
jgi:AcrR family transcriptional regulator